MNQDSSHFSCSESHLSSKLVWQGPKKSIAFDPGQAKSILSDLNRTCYVVETDGRIGITGSGEIIAAPRAGKEMAKLLAAVPPSPPEALGDPGFLSCYGVKYAYYAGSMANGISSEEMVTKLGREKILASFGAAGLDLSRIEKAIRQLRIELPEGPYAFNLINHQGRRELEQATVELFLKNGIKTVEASAFLDLDSSLVYYRVAGLSLNPQGRTEINNRVIAKVSRKELAAKFMQPAPEKILRELVESRMVSEQQAMLAERVPMADDITAEMDSAGHTDKRSLAVLLPSLLELRDQVQDNYRYDKPVRVGVAGGISTPEAAMAVFSMGAAYIVTGSVNQACVEAGTSEHVRQLLAQAEMTDVSMAPAADMFEMGIKVQVLKKGTMFPMRAGKLYDLYQRYESMEDIPEDEKKKLEKQYFQRSLNQIWQETKKFFAETEPEKYRLAEQDPRRKMALVFRWYLGLSSKWANEGKKGREMDYQVWCGPAIGAFNDWARGTYLEQPSARRVVDVARHIMTGTAYLSRVQCLRLQGINICGSLARYRPLLNLTESSTQ